VAESRWGYSWYLRLRPYCYSVPMLGRDWMAVPFPMSSFPPCRGLAQNREHSNNEPGRLPDDKDGEGLYWAGLPCMEGLDWVGFAYWILALILHIRTDSWLVASCQLCATVNRVPNLCHCKSCANSVPESPSSCYECYDKMLLPVSRDDACGSICITCRLNH